MDSDAQLAYSRQLLGVLRLLTRKLVQADLVFGMRSWFISRPVHARLQVSVCSGYDLFYPWLPARHAYTHIHTSHRQTERQHFDQLIYITNSSAMADRPRDAYASTVIL